MQENKAHVLKSAQVIKDRNIVKYFRYVITRHMSTRPKEIQGTLENSHRTRNIKCTQTDFKNPIVLLEMKTKNLIIEIKTLVTGYKADWSQLKRNSELEMRNEGIIKVKRRQRDGKIQKRNEQA
jgi:hypothetical protein